MSWLRIYIIIWGFAATFSGLNAQTDDCNSLGVWLWHIETTGFSHDLLAKNLASLGVKRVYAKVADGAIDSIAWPELIDETLVTTYNEQGLEVWAWSYNYTSNPNRQAAALYRAAKTGYDGYVVDVEMEFDGKAEALSKLFEAFDRERLEVMADGLAQDSFPIYCTTWGNPKDHNYSISSIDPYVDGYMPQTYVEYWGQNYIDNISYWIREGNKEYKSLGATKPIHHIASTATGVMTPELIDEFIAASGPATSLWRIPGGGLTLDVWKDWRAVDWGENFCNTSNASSINSSKEESINVYPNPTSDIVTITGTEKSAYELYNLYGEKLMVGRKTQTLSLAHLDAGVYILRSTNSNEAVRILKL